MPDADAPPRYCRRCGYDLRATSGDTPRCPECGRSFNPANPRTTRRRPLRRWLRHVKRLAFALAALLLLLAATWGWFYWGWLDEQRALRELGLPLSGSTSMHPRLRDRLGVAGFVFDRVTDVYIFGRNDPPDLRPIGRLRHIRELHVRESQVSDISPLAALAHLERLDLDRNPVSDVRPLAGLRRLQELNLGETRVSDLTPLSALTNLEFLLIDWTAVRDLAPLAALENLRQLDVSNTQVSDLTPLRDLPLHALELHNTPVLDLSPLAGHRHLRSLSVARTPVRDLTPLRSITSLEFVALPSNIDDAQAEALESALPGASIVR